jgi:AraC family transcriptional regulator of adaptative response/methylated-DNA-[protein]-cysteine methyltransferase
METAAGDYERIALAIRWLDAHRDAGPGVPEIAAAVGLRPSQFHALFRRWAGVPPHRFLQHLRAARARAALAGGAPLLEASLEAGLSGPGRLHDLCVQVDAATPAQIRDRGAGLALRFGLAPTPFGTARLAASPRGICALTFDAPANADEAAEALLARWPRATLTRDDALARSTVERIFRSARQSGAAPLTIHLQGTNFQLKVWQALLAIPPGTVESYAWVAAAVGAPAATRAVGTAVGANPLAFVIPCHRVLRADGTLGGYRWGLLRKRAMLAWETVRDG